MVNGGFRFGEEPPFSVTGCLLLLSVVPTIMAGMTAHARKCIGQTDVLRRAVGVNAR